MLFRECVVWGHYRSNEEQILIYDWLENDGFNTIVWSYSVYKIGSILLLWFIMWYAHSHNAWKVEK